jgi:hypothetical protein
MQSRRCETGYREQSVGADGGRVKEVLSQPEERHQQRQL